MSGKDTQDVKVAEGLGGSNVSGLDDPRVRSELPSAGEGGPSDPDWVHRKDPGSLPKYMPQAGEGVGFDPANMSVTNVAGAGSLEGTEGGRSDQHMGPTTLMGNRDYEVGGRGNPEVLGVRGADTGVGAMGAGPRTADRSSAGANYLSTQPGAGKGAERARTQAGVEFEGANVQP